jgi:nucleoside-diphosphate-sugar epimerase
MAKLVIGCGYLGERVARLWKSRGHQVHVTTRSSTKAEWWAAQGYVPHVVDVMDPASLADLPLAETVLFSVGFDRSAGVSIRQVYVEGLRAVLGAISPQTGKFIYISSTGVYGQTDGEWVDETSPTQPRREAGRACLDAEHVLATHSLGMRSVVLRLAGIYGPGRLPRREELLAGQPLLTPGDGYLNLIHVDDAARIVLLAEERASVPRLYAVADGHPILRREYYTEFCRLIGAPPPKFAPPDPNAPAQRGDGSKRIRVDRMMGELLPELRYPSYREGLAAILSDAAEP